MDDNLTRKSETLRILDLTGVCMGEDFDHECNPHADTNFYFNPRVTDTLPKIYLIIYFA